MSGPAFHDATGPAPDVRTPRFLWLLFGASAPPLAWLGHMVLAYGVTAYRCYPADHPVMPVQTDGLFLALMVFDLIAVAICAAGGLVSWRGWQRSRGAAGYGRFLALWGMMSGLCFAAAILFNIVASLMVPLCRG